MLIALIAVVAVHPAGAQGLGGDTVRLTSRDVATWALSEHPEVLRHRAGIDRARAERLRASNFFPSLPEAEYARMTDAPFHASGEGDWEIGITQEIEIGGQYFLRRDAAEAGVMQAELETRAVELAVRAELRTAFVRLIAAQARMSLLDTLVGFARRLDAVAARLLGAEEISELDRNAVRIERGRIEIERLNAATAASDVRSELARLLGLPSGSVVVALPAAIDSSLIRSLLDSVSVVETLLASGDESVLRRRPDWGAIEHARERLRLERSLASRRWIPSIRLGLRLRGETTVLDGEDITGGSDAVRTGFGQLRSDDRFLGFHVGVQIPLPLAGLYDVGRGDLAAADADAAALDAGRLALAARIRTDVVRAAGRLRNAAQAYAIYTREIAPLVRRNLELLERGYSAGELGSVQIISGQEQFLRSGETLIETEREFGEALADFDRAVAR